MRLLIVMTLVITWTQFFSQDSLSTYPELIPKRKSKFQTGFYIGPYFPNNYSASAYNGYGFNLAGAQNDFANSLMYQKIINEYGGYNVNPGQGSSGAQVGQQDLVAQALGVDYHQWVFGESDMPVNMHYLKAIMLGINVKIPVDKRNAFLLNVNASKIGVEGNFTMTLLRPQNQPQNPGTNSNFKTLTITGKEQRMVFQLGLQHLFGEDEKLNFLLEGGFLGTLAKYDRNTIYINTLEIDLTTYLNSVYNPATPSRKPIGFGIGAFVGAGVNVNFNARLTLQFLYTLSHEKVNIGVAPKLRLQNAAGVRFYYNF